MSVLRTFFSSLFSRTFLAGLLFGAVLGAGGLKLFSVAYMQMGDGGDMPEQARYLAPIALSDSTTATVRGTIPDNWTLRSMDGSETTFGALQRRPTLLTVGATWCEPCTAAMSTLQALHDTTGQAVRVAYVSFEPRDSLRRHLDEKGFSMPAYVADDVPSVLEGDVIPRTYLVRSNGAVVYRHVGPADWSDDAAHRLLEHARPSTTAPGSAEGKGRTPTDRGGG